MAPTQPSRPEIVGNTVLIAGFGREGQSVYRYLRQVLPNITIAVADENTELTIDPAVLNDPRWENTAKYFGALAWESISEYETIVRSPGISPDTLQPYGPQHLTSATNLFFAAQPGRVIGVTGTKGKSTTSAITAHFLRAHYEDVRLVGNIGIPVLDFLEDATTETLFVMELSSYQLLDCRYSPHIAVVLNIVPEHLNYHGTFTLYQQAKSNIVRHQTEHDHVVFNPDHDTAMIVADLSDGQPHHFSTQKRDGSEVTVTEETIVIDTHTQLSRTESSLQGRGNNENLAAAITVAKILGVPSDVIAAAIPSFQALPHRLEPVGTFQGITFVNDSLSTIPQATINAVSALQPPVHTVIVGGFDRGISYEPLEAFLASQAHSVKLVIGLPQTGHQLIDTLQQRAPHLTTHRADTLEEAVEYAFAHTPAGTTCVLSPAAASFNQYRDYAERGAAFKRFVQQHI